MKSYEESWLLVSIVKKKNRKKKRRMPFKNHCCSMCVWSDVFILLFKCISVSVPPSYDVGWWKNWARLTNGGKKQRLGCVGVSNLALSTPPPANPPVNHRGRPTSDLLCLSGILIGSPAAHVDCSFTVCLSLWHTHRNTHTHNKHTLLPVCVWFYDRSSEDFLGLFLCFLFFFFLLFFVLHGRSELLWQRVFQKRF